MFFPCLDLPFYNIFHQTPIHFCPLISFSSAHIFFANNPKSDIINYNVKILDMNHVQSLQYYDLLSAVKRVLRSESPKPEI